MASEREAQSARWSLAEIRKLLTEVMQIPLAWVISMALFAVLSCLKITHPSDGGMELEFAVTTTTVGAVALVWLPPLLRVLTLTGGRLKAAGVEASSGGLLGSDADLLNSLTSIKTATEEAGRRAPEASEALESVDEAVDQMATEYLGGSDAVNREAVDRLAEDYENLRSTLPSGDARTVEMTRVVNEARLRAAADPREASAWGLRLIRSRREGERIVGLSFLQAAPAAGALEDVLELISGSATAFEMFHALLALESLAPLLSAVEKAHAEDVLTAEESDPRGVGVTADPNLPPLIAQVRVALGALPPAGQS